MTFFPSFVSRRTSRRFARTGAVAACCLSLFFGAFATAGQPEQAQEASPIAAIAPFVDADTTAVARLNVQNLDVDRLRQTLGDVVATALQNVGYNAEAVAALRPKLDASLSAVADGKAAFDAFRAASGLTEIYFVAQTAATETGFADEAGADDWLPLDSFIEAKRELRRETGVALLVPVDSLVSSQLQLLKGFAKDFAEDFNLETAVYKKRWLVFAPDLKAFGDYYKNFKSSKNEKIETFFQKNADAAFAAYCGKVEVRRFLVEATDGELALALSEAPRAVSVALNTFDASFADLRLTVAPETLVARADFRFDSADDAERMSNALYDLVDAGLDKFHAEIYRYGEPFEDLDKELVAALNLDPLAREILRAEIRAQLPKIDGDSLVWELDLPSQADKTLKSATFVAAAAFLLGLAYGDAL